MPFSPMMINAQMQRMLAASPYMGILGDMPNPMRFPRGMPPDMSMYCDVIWSLISNHMRGGLFVCVYVCMFVCLLLCLFLCFCVCLFVYFCVCLFLCLFVSVFVCLFVCLFVSVFVCLFLCLFVSVFVCFCVCLFVLIIC